MRGDTLRTTDDSAWGKSRHRGRHRFGDGTPPRQSASPFDVISRASSRRDELRCLAHSAASKIVTMDNSIPTEIRGQKYISLTTFRKSGAGVATPVWFGEEDGKLYVMTISKMGKVKRIRNNPQVQVAPCTIRGKVTGGQFPATARLLPPEDFARARKTITRKYWLAWITTPFSRADAFIELSFA